MKTTIILYFTCFLMIFSLNASAAKTEYSPKKVSIYWDASFSMQSKNLEKELSFLEAFFLTTSDVTVELVVFSNTIELQKSFHIVHSDWSNLKEVLQQIKYDGVAFYDVLLENSQSDLAMLFTDGVSVIDELLIDKKTPTYIISSSLKIDVNTLITQSIRSGGNYIDLIRLTIPEGIAILKNESTEAPKTKKKSYVNIKRKTTQQKSLKNYINGTVYAMEGGLEGAAISVKGKTVGVTTNAQGEFSIKAKKGDVLLVSYLGKKTRTIVVKNSAAIDIFLVEDENALEEVVVKGIIEQEAELVETGYGKLDKKKLGYAVRTISGERLNAANATNLSDAVRNKMGATNHSDGSDISMIAFRGKNFALVVIDGMPLRRNLYKNPQKTNKLLDFLDPQNVASVTVLKGLAATNRFGGEGGQGVILITTKTAVMGNKSKKKHNSALAKNNDYTEDITELNANKTLYNIEYLKEYEKLTSLQEVYGFYLKQRANYRSDPLYFTNVSDYISLWGNKEMATKILTNVLEINSNNISSLKLVAYKLEQQNKFFLAKRVYEKIAKLQPKDAQSYRDLALIYQKTGYYQKALDIYKKIEDNAYYGVDFSGLRKIIYNEKRRLVAQHKDKLNLSDFSKPQSTAINIDARIVFEWNETAIDFELQFVNPQKKFFTWSHTKLENGLRLHKEKIQGFNAEEFLLVDVAKGEWIINIENKQHTKNQLH